MIIRIVMFASSGDYWFIGECVLYLVLITYTLGLVINKHFPAYEKIPSLGQTQTNIVKTP